MFTGIGQDYGYYYVADAERVRKFRKSDLNLEESWVHPTESWGVETGALGITGRIK